MSSLILIVEGCDRHFYHLGKATLIVGRRDDSDIHLPSEIVSHDHASIILEEGRFVLHDNGSANGSYVNGELVKKQILQHMDLVRFGDYLFLVDLEGTIPAAHGTPVAGEMEIEPPRPRTESPTLPHRTSQKIMVRLTDPVNLPKDLGTHSDMIMGSL